MLIGPMTNVEANLVGGATISFGYLEDYLRRKKENYTLINTKRFFNSLRIILNPLYVFLKVILNIPKTNVIFLNSSRGGTKYIAPILFILSKIFRLKFVFRPFGGNIKEYTAEYSKLHQWIFRNTTLKADLLFLQTKELINFYAKYNPNISQLPTSRNEPENILLKNDHSFKKRFIYLGFINEYKGINHLLEAAKVVGEDITIHIYGPIMDSSFHQKFEEQPHIYQGVLKKDDVLSTLKNYDVLVLPTFYEGEGYPGSIIEAYSLGLPVITTHWKAIPEIVVDQKTGILIKPQSTKKLVEAIQYFNETNYSTFSKNARQYFQESFQTEKVSSQAIAQIKTLFHQKRK